MKQVLLLLAISCLMSGKCGDKKKEEENRQTTGDAAIPACVQQLLDDAARATPSTLPIQVDEYTYKGKKVYLFTADCCDFYNYVYDENCNKLCAPSGGITGRGDGQCADFDSLAKQVKPVWKKKRD